jgi:23S rRNA pseudouridine2605 synthase
VESERIQKRLAALGLGSRREIERWIQEGRIQVNGETAKLGDQINDNDEVKLNDKLIRHAKAQTQNIPHQVIAVNKPLGIICTRSDPEGRETVFSLIEKPKQGRWIAVGRLDMNTSGLLLLTTDGELANRLMHPSTEIQREYLVRVLGEVSGEVIHALLGGVMLEDGVGKFDSIEYYRGQGANQWYRVLISEGRNREVRRLWESQGVKVSRLIRSAYGPIRLWDKLKAGESRLLTSQEVDALYKVAGLARVKGRAGPGKKRPKKVQ